MLSSTTIYIWLVFHDFSINYTLCGPQRRTSSNRSRRCSRCPSVGTPRCMVCTGEWLQALDTAYISKCGLPLPDCRSPRRVPSGTGRSSRDHLPQIERLEGARISWVDRFPSWIKPSINKGTYYNCFLVLSSVQIFKICLNKGPTDFEK